MKYCPNCQREYPDDAAFCSADGSVLEAGGQPESEEIPAQESNTHNEIPLEEKRLWANMGFRQLLILFIRLQAIWLFFNAAIDTTYLLRYFIHFISLHEPARYLVTTYREEIFWMFVRTMMNVAAGVWLIQKSERFLSWLVKDWVTPKPSISNQASGEPQDDTTANEE